MALLITGALRSAADTAADASPSAGANPSDAEASYITLDEVSVSAVKQMSALRREPEAATILTQPELERLDVVSIKGISDVVPNFFMPDYGSRITSSIYVRGIGARMDQPSVGLNVDNVPFLNKDAYDFDLADIVNVEMLRGPQSTLYGRNTMAGVINITTLSPLRYQGWRIQADLSTRLRGKVSAGWYHKFSDNTGLSLTANYSGARGEFINRYNGKRLDKEQSYGARAKFQWRITPEWMLQNTAAFSNLRQGGYPYEYLPTGTIAYNDTCFYRRLTFSDGLTARYSGDRVSVTSITSLQHIHDNMTLDQDFLPADYFTLTQRKHEIALTEDIVVRKAAPEGVYNWLAGFFGFYKHLDMEAPVTFKDTGISQLIEQHRNNAIPSYPIEWDTRSFPLNSDFTLPTWGVALYHESVVTLGAWELTAGLRADYEKSTLDYHSFCNTGYTTYRVNGGEKVFFGKGDVNIDDRGELSRDYLTLLPKIAVTYTLPANNGNIYAKLSRGYKAGGFNTQMFSDVLQQRLMNLMGIGSRYDVDDVVGYKPEKSWNYEVGAHLNTTDGKIEADIALFYIDCRDQQLTTFPDGTTTGRIMTNAGKTRSFGGELTISYRPTERLTLTGSYGHTNARFRRFNDGINDYSGNYLPYAPANTLFLQGVWMIPLRKDRGVVVLDVNMRGTGKIYWNEANTVTQPFYALAGAGVTYSKGDFSVQLWGKNLTDTRYHTFYFLSMGNEFLQRGKGIEGGVTVRYNFR
jgi:outer membrane receptor protein involved in Fe transport